jgi:hypothetical protein
MAKSTTGLSYYAAEKMSLDRLKDEVCEADAETCRMCECFRACAIGRRYVQEVSAGRILEGGNAPPPAPLIERQARAFTEAREVVTHSSPPDTAKTMGVTWGPRGVAVPR